MLKTVLHQPVLLGKTVLPGKQPFPYNKNFIDLISESEASYPNAARVVQPVRTAQMMLNGAAVADAPCKLACHPTFVG